MIVGLGVGVSVAFRGYTSQFVSTASPPFLGIAVPGGELNDAFPGLANEIAAYVAAGVKRVRFDFRQTDLGGGNYTTQDTIVNAVRGAGIEIVGILNPNTDLSDTTERSGYATYCGNVAAHYVGNVIGWEVCNEPNLAGATAVLMADYAPALVLAYAAIKAADPNALVIAGGLASIETTGGGHQSAVAFVNYIYDNAPGAFDAISYHSYTDSATVGWLSSLGATWHTRTILLAVISAMTAKGDTTRKVHVTETGMPTIGSGLTEDWQYKWLRDSHAELFANKRIAGYYWYSWINRQAEAVGQDGYGMVRANNAPKKVLHEAKRLITLDNDTTPTFEHFKGAGNSTIDIWRRFVSADSPLLSNITWSLVGAPTGVAINSSTGVITITDATVSPQSLTAIITRATHTNG